MPCFNYEIDLLLWMVDDPWLCLVARQATDEVCFGRFDRAGDSRSLVIACVHTLYN